LSVLARSGRCLRRWETRCACVAAATPGAAAAHTRCVRKAGLGGIPTGGGWGSQLPEIYCGIVLYNTTGYKILAFVIGCAAKLRPKHVTAQMDSLGLTLQRGEIIHRRRQERPGLARVV